MGRGGMGVVYRATQLDLDRTVALKVVAPDLLDETVARRFLQESRLAASIDHPHVIPIYYAGEEAGVPYLAMRYVAGDDGRSARAARRARSRRRGRRGSSRRSPARSTPRTPRGLVHRDVKPANVLLAAGDHAYLADFGLTPARPLDSGATTTRVSGSGRSTTSRPSRSAAARSTRAPTSTRWAASSSSCSPAACRSRARATRPSCGRTSPSRPPSRQRSGARGCRVRRRDPARAREVARRPLPVGGRPRPRGRGRRRRRARGRARAHRRARGSGHLREADGHAPRIPRSATPAPAGRRSRSPVRQSIAVAAASRARSRRSRTAPSARRHARDAHPVRGRPGAARRRHRALGLASQRAGAGRGSHLGRRLAHRPPGRHRHGRQPSDARPAPARRWRHSGHGPHRRRPLGRDARPRGPALDPERGRRLAAPVPLAMDPSALAVRGDDVWVGQELDDGPAADRPHRCPHRGHRRPPCRPHGASRGWCTPTAVCGRSTASRTTSSGAIP